MSTKSPHALLEFSKVTAGYSQNRVLNQISFSIKPGESIGLLGRNGMGKTTMVRAIMRQLPWQIGSICLDNQRLDGLPTHRITRMGVGLVPEGRRIFLNLTVKENLTAFSSSIQNTQDWNLEKVFTLFPQLANRINKLGSYLSGGERQMLAIGRALMTNPKLLILDEATEGLAPAMRTQVWDCLTKLKRKKLSLLLIDKQISEVLKLTDFIMVLNKGQIVWQGSSAELACKPETLQRLLDPFGKDSEVEKDRI